MGADGSGRRTICSTGYDGFDFMETALRELHRGIVLNPEEPITTWRDWVENKIAAMEMHKKQFTQAIDRDRK